MNKITEVFLLPFPLFCPFKVLCGILFKPFFSKSCYENIKPI
jgi:hypothetical protein